MKTDNVIRVDFTARRKPVPIFPLIFLMFAFPLLFWMTGDDQ